MLARPTGAAVRSAQLRYRALLGQNDPVHLSRLQEAAGVPSAWVQSSNHPSRNHADGATLGRQMRTGRPDLMG